MTELRSSIFIDKLQPQTMCYLGSWIRGTLPRTNMAAQIIEVAPGLDIEPLTDVALKEAEVSAGVLVVERQYGYLEFHSHSPDAVRQSAEAIMSSIDAEQADVKKPTILASKIVTNIDHAHAFLINRRKKGSMVLPGESLFLMEIQPASYAILVVNEAEKASAIKVVDFSMMGATGRVYLAGDDDSVRAASDVAHRVISDQQ